MAPLNGSAKARRPGGGKQAPKPVVPAIPLPHVKRQVAAAAAASSKAEAKSSSPAVQPEAKLSNGNGHGRATVASPTTSDEGVSWRGAKDQPQVTEGDIKTNGHDSTAASISEPTSSTGEPQDSPKAITTETPGKPDQPTTEGKFNNHDHAEASPPNLAVGANSESNGVAVTGEMKPRPIDHHPAKAPNARQPPPMSPNRYQIPPLFQPASRPMNMASNGDMHRGPRPPMPNGPPHMHQPHPSNGSVHFGAFHDSTSSSPAPPPSGGIAPPPGMAVPDARNPYMGHAGNGYPPMMPYGPDMMPPVTTYDNFARPAMAYGPMDAFPPFGNNFGPSASQASAHPEDSTMFAQFPARSAAAGRGEDSQPANHHTRMFSAPDFPRAMPNHGPPPHMMSQVDNADGLVDYLQMYFASSDMSDCALELWSTDKRQLLLRVPGHLLVFARSSKLRNKIARNDSGEGQQRILRIETDSRWIRPDSFYTAVQRLYGHPLFQIPQGMKRSDTINAGSVVDKLHFALSYAAAGHLLGWDSVVRQGCEIAIQLLDWQTIESAIEFALEEYCDGGHGDQYKYGEGSRAILSAIVNYIIHNLPPNFTIDSSLPEPAHYARLPAHPSQPQAGSTQEPASDSPAIARGTSVHLSKGRRSQKLSGIQFGDLSLGEAKKSATSETPKASQQQPRHVSHAILSNVLVNLPFPYLKMTLESAGSSTANSWANAEYRYRVVKEAVAEREARRLRAVEAVKDGKVEEAESIRKQLSNPEPQLLNQWAILGWQERIVPHANPNGPGLGRQWTPLMEPRNGVQAEYP